MPVNRRALLYLYLYLHLYLYICSIDLYRSLLNLSASEGVGAQKHSARASTVYTANDVRGSRRLKKIV